MCVCVCIIMYYLAIKSNNNNDNFDVIILLLFCFLFQEHVAQTACMRACQHMAKTLMTYLTDDNVKFISAAALEQFDLDVRECESSLSAIILYRYSYKMAMCYPYI